MGKIFYIMGKSASGKDTVYQHLLKDHSLGLRHIVPYTTRPIREGEEPGREYFFCDESKVDELTAQGKIIELRVYQTVYGKWKYFTVNDEQINLHQQDLLMIGTLESYVKVREYFGKEVLEPIYIEVEDGERLMRAIAREREQAVPKYEEMCRRFLADASDFSEEKLREAGIRKCFVNETLTETLQEITAYIRRKQEGDHGNQGK